MRSANSPIRFISAASGIAKPARGIPRLQRFASLALASARNDHRQACIVRPCRESLLLPRPSRCTRRGRRGITIRARGEGILLSSFCASMRRASRSSRLLPDNHPRRGKRRRPVGVREPPHRMSHLARCQGGRRQQGGKGAPQRWRVTLHLAARCAHRDGMTTSSFPSFPLFNALSALRFAMAPAASRGNHVAVGRVGRNARPRRTVNRDRLRQHDSGVRFPFYTLGGYAGALVPASLPPSREPIPLRLCCVK